MSRGTERSVAATTRPRSVRTCCTSSGVASTSRAAPSAWRSSTPAASSICSPPRTSPAPGRPKPPKRRSSWTPSRPTSTDQTLYACRPSTECSSTTMSELFESTLTVLCLTTPQSNSYRRPLYNVSNSISLF